MNLSKTPKIKSLKQKDEITDILSSGKTIRTKYGPVFFKRIPDEKNNYIGILIKKKCGNSVKRNRIKRLIRRFIHHHSSLLDLNNRTIFLYSYIGKIDFASLETEYLKAVDKI